jgi:P-type conjugative transfer protein TrbG
MNNQAFLRLAPSIILLFATGCGGRQRPAPPLVPANFAAVTQPPINVPPDPLNSLPPALRWAYRNKSYKPVQSGFETFYPYQQYEEPTIRCGPGHITEIVLASDEKVTAATVGDSVRWMVVPEQNKIRVKACPQGCAMGVGAAAAQSAVAVAPTVYATNLIIDTDRRTYHVKLQAGPLARAMESFAFWYPEDIAAAEAARATAMRKGATQAAVDPPVHLNFNYRVTGPSVPWKPVQAFDDGSHEYLLFANTAALESDMPSLYVEHGSNQELVNYQVRQNYYVVDRLYADAALTQGVGSDRQTVRIEAMEDR